mgnify:CR=1 FL=1
MNRRAEGREGCVRACFCAARSYNRGEPQGAANSPRLSNRFGGLASCYGSLSLRIGSRSIIAVKNPSKLEANSRIAAIKPKRSWRPFQAIVAASGKAHHTTRRALARNESV